MLYWHKNIRYIVVFMLNFCFNVMLMSNFRLVLCFKHIVVLMLYFFYLMLYWYQNLIVFLLVLYRSHIVAKILCWYCNGVQFWTSIIFIVHWCQILLKLCIDIVLMTHKKPEQNSIDVLTLQKERNAYT